jgi:hypothetical protein
MRRLVGEYFGGDALRWFDEAQRTVARFLASGSNLHFGAFFGTSHDRDGLVQHEGLLRVRANQIDALPADLFGVVSAATSMLSPSLRPLFTTIAAQRDRGGQRLTCAYPAPLRLADLQPLSEAFGLGKPLTGDLQIVGITLGAPLRPADGFDADGHRPGARRSRVRALHPARPHPGLARELPGRC